MTMPIIHGPAYSGHVRVVRICLAEKKVEAELREIDLLRGEARKPAHRKLHPFGKVPVFEHSGNVIYETVPIARYIDAVFSGPALQPSDPVAAARMNQILAVLETYIHPLMIGQIVMQYARRRYLGRPLNRGAIQKAMPQLRDGFAALERLMGEGAFVVGPSLTLADIFLGAFLDPFTRTPEGKRSLPKFAKIERWWEGFRNRPSMQATAIEI
jgi:glutathione S-transferase